MVENSFQINTPTPSGNFTASTGTNTPALPKAYQSAFDLCVRKKRVNIDDLADEPKTWAWAVDGAYSKYKEAFFEIGCWTPSFFTGMALLAWRATED